MKNNHDRPTILERLEQRQLLAAATYQVIRGALHVIGTDNDDVIVLRQSSKLFSSPRYADVRNVIVEGRGGNDTLLGCAGDDLIIDTNGEDQLFGADGNDNLQANDGQGGDHLEAGGPDESWSHDPDDTGDFPA